MECGNYRAICLPFIAFNVYTKLVKGESERHLEEEEEHNIFILRKRRKIKK